MITCHQVSLRIGKRHILQDIDLHVQPGEFWAVLGPNGAGKSTLLRLLTGRMKPSSGAITLDGLDLATWQPTPLARRRAVLFQNSTTQSAFTVEELVALGRLPHHAGRPSAADHAAIATALEWTGLEHLAHRHFEQLSGGEQQRVHLARALAQLQQAGSFANQLLLLDEPLNSLDPYFQYQVLEIANRVVDAGGAVISVLHDLNLALRYAGHALLLHQGLQVAAGPARQVLQPAHVTDVYRVSCAWNASGTQLDLAPAFRSSTTTNLVSHVPSP